LIDITQKLAIWADALRAIAQTGLAFQPHTFDQERYEALLELAGQMEATLNGSASLDAGLAAEFDAYWRSQIRAGVPGYVTPKVGVGAIVFNDRDELLLICRRDSQHWLYPTGWLDVGLTPAQTAVKEVREETGLAVRADKLLGVFDGSLRGYPLPFHMISVMITCRLLGGELKPHPVETLGAGFFARDRLPRPLHLEGDWVDQVFRFHHGEGEPIVE
jgi:ADP-ribose pyrophosphatase YjhB (NUDIX family)